MDIYFFSGTHWDREWYQTFQGFRFRLVKMIDGLIDGLESDEFGVFHLDGQTIVLEDYLEIMPQNKERLEKLIQNGKLVVGPWYCMPDEFLVSGESLIKNLQKGFKIARAFGAEPLKYGYICDIFGHIAQMPQIFAQMGIDYALLGRGTNESTTPMHFVWQAPDGSKVTTFKLQDQHGYGSFSQAVIGDETKAETLTDVYLREKIKELTDYEIHRANVPVILLMDAIDHTSYHKDTARYLKILEKLYPEAQIHHNNIMNMCETLKPYQEKFVVKYGEVREPAEVRGGYIHLITHTLSSRYPLKKYNDRMQTLLEKWIQPLYAFGLVDLPISYLDLANNYLLQNHPHDSICGCSIDRVHEDMQYRFHQTDMICGQILDEFKMSLSSNEDAEYKIIKIFNPLPYAYNGVIELDINFEKDYKTFYQEPFGYEKINSFKIYDADNHEIPYGISNITTNWKNRTYNQYVEESDIYKVVIQVDLIPMGITELIIKPYDKSSRYLEKMNTSERSAENEYLKLEIISDGSLSIYDKNTNTIYQNLLTAMDDGEIGDGWYHVNPACDKIITNTVCEVEKTEDNYNRVTFRVTQKLHLPKCMVYDKFGIRRNDCAVPFEIVHHVSLKRGARFVDVQTSVKNTAEDHRLRIKIPTGVRGDTYFANQAFCFVERRTGIDVSTQNWRECEVPEKSMGGIVLKKNESHGLAFISKYGLHECAVFENGDMIITLFRSFGKTVMTNGEKGGQLLEDMEFSYQVMPLDNTIGFADLQKQQDFLQAGVQTVLCSGGMANKHESIMELEGKNVAMSTANKTPDGIEIRIVNLSQEPSTANIKLKQNISSASVVNLDGESEEVITANQKNIQVPLKPWQFKTVIIR